ncbi:LysM peptidoglycan-binding domain-containing protein [Streptomyces sp. NRRL B-1677]|uniref:LysM peptidoglycan-binding domain-containing protein n=1 Tax=Streptomyces klenkii TaxID=1420899 RepID=A0A3B0BFR0_9ACTN|nr:MULTISPECIES: transglycosylase family protein [Streptomyces]MBF6044756.1 LysM peptidoglycan-binding domain-containing protein [Streptomyces sp. NRRL B-1677]RKN71164.1 LysM peptidoglycan-binding domain-containing protein [Streptomyces klenkii]
MRPGTGRHRRPRQIPAIVVAAGVTASGIALPLLAATGANAADAGTWDRVAQCESGGLWSADSGNGSYGGLQLTQDLWDRNGGREYAPRPDLASRAQQIAVAEHILETRGNATWSSCAARSGLTSGGTKADVNPGGTHAPASDSTPSHDPERTTSPSAPSEPDGHSKPSEPSASPSQSGKPSTEPSAQPSAGMPSPDKSSGGPSGKPSGSASPDGSSSKPGDTKPGDGKAGDGKPGDDASGEPGEGRHRKPSTSPAGDDPTSIPTSPESPAAPSQGAPDGSGSAGGQASDGVEGGSGKHRADPSRSDDTRSSRGGGEGRTGSPTATDYTVRPGDNLSVIAEQHAVNGGWQSLYHRNEKVVGTDPDLILPGQKLEMGK